MLALAESACADAGELALVRASAQAHSPYTDQQASPIRGLTVQEIDDLTNGRGMGLARAAELNEHPGPRHVLELRTQLGVDAATAERTAAIIEEMTVEARALGAQILTQERALNQAFADRSVTRATLDAKVAALAERYGALRAVHLAAHLETRALLTSEQVAHYAVLRGYVEAPAAAGHAAHGAGQHGSR